VGYGASGSTWAGSEEDIIASSRPPISPLRVDPEQKVLLRRHDITGLAHGRRLSDRCST
jgi:hypothetical protein